METVLLVLEAIALVWTVSLAIAYWRAWCFLRELRRLAQRRDDNGD